jgi:hypothetical protein
MPTKRTPITRQRTPLVTPQIVDLYRHAIELRTQARRIRTNAAWEAAGDAESAVNRALNIKLWETSLFDAIDFPHENDGTPDWLRAAELARQLQEADRELRRQERKARRAKNAPRCALVFDHVIS